MKAGPPLAPQSILLSALMHSGELADNRPGPGSALALLTALWKFEVVTTRSPFFP